MCQYADVPMCQLRVLRRVGRRIWAISFHRASQYTPKGVRGTLSGTMVATDNAPLKGWKYKGIYINLNICYHPRNNELTNHVSRAVLLSPDIKQSPTHPVRGALLVENDGFTKIPCITPLGVHCDLRNKTNCIFHPARGVLLVEKHAVTPPERITPLGVYCDLRN